MTKLASVTRESTMLALLGNLNRLRERQRLSRRMPRKPSPRLSTNFKLRKERAQEHKSLRHSARP